MSWLTEFLSTLLADIFRPIIESFLVKKPSKVLHQESEISKTPDPTTDDDLVERFGKINGKTV